MTKAGLADLTIPISSFQVFKRRDGTVGVQVTTRKFDLANAIADRARGYIVVSAAINGVLEEVGTGNSRVSVTGTLAVAAACDVADCASGQGRGGQSQGHEAEVHLG